MKKRIEEEYNLLTYGILENHQSILTKVKVSLYHKMNKVEEERNLRD